MPVIPAPERDSEDPEFEARPDWAIKWEQFRTKPETTKGTCFGSKFQMFSYKVIRQCCFGLMLECRTEEAFLVHGCQKAERETGRGQGSKNFLQGHSHDDLTSSTKPHLSHSYHTDWGTSLQYVSQTIATWSLKAEFPKQRGWRSEEALVMGRKVLFMLYENVLEI